MCRILGLQADGPVDAVPWIEAFGRRCRDSQEFQGHGWGMSWQEDGRWQRYRSIRPIWKDRVELPSTRLVLVHARSAFRDEGIVVENNMPFLSGELAFAFNGELHGVRLSAPGATGAARLLHLLERFGTAAAGDTLAALARLDALVALRSDYVRALNIVVSDGRAFFINTSYSEDQDYFTLHTASVPSPHGLRMVSSETISTGEIEPQWVSIPNHSTRVLDADSTCSS
jgi:predicted glutamine amidotransferase